MKSIEEFYPNLRSPANTVITMHQKPDPDAMGSSLSLAAFLSKLGHNVSVISPTNWAEFLKWMPGCKDVTDFEATPEKARPLIEQADWIFCLDFNALHRTKNMEQALLEAKGIRILIDHHQQPDTEKFAYGVSNTSKSSTCEMVYDFIVGSGNAELIDADIASCLYAGIIGDTGSFRFKSTSAEVHEMVAFLKRRGLEHIEVHELLYDNFLENRLRFIGHVLQHRMEIYYEYNAALIAIPKNDLLKFNIKTGDTEGLVNYPLSIQGIKMAALVIDRDEERKWSFRSKGKVDVNTFARTYFNGGGHFNASGGRSSDSLHDTVQRFQQALKENEQQLQ